MLFCADDASLVRLVFDLVDLEDDVEHVLRFRRGRIQGFEEVPPEVTQAACALAARDVADVIVSGVTKLISTFSSTLRQKDR